jgi:hypothetical protein
MGLRPLACWDCGFESRWGHGCLSFVSVVCCQVEVTATGRLPAKRSSTELSRFYLETSRMMRSRPTSAVELCRKYVYILEFQLEWIVKFPPQNLAILQGVTAPCPEPEESNSYLLNPLRPLCI